MVYGLMADLHVHPWSMFAATDADGMNDRLAGLLKEIQRCATEVHAAGGALVVMAGDVFHVRGSMRPTVLNALKDALAWCNQNHGTVFEILAGNHDLEGQDSNRLGSAVTALECGYVQIINATIASQRRLMVPWYKSVAELKAELEEKADLFCADEKSGMDLILHAPIDGVIVGLPDHGLTGEWLSSLGFRRVFAGHYHNHKLVYDNTISAPPGCIPEPCQVYSIGALAHHTWSDIGTRAGFLLVSDDEVDYRASHLPRFIDLGELAAGGYDEDEIAAQVAQNFVRVKVEANKQLVETARSELLAMGARAVLVQPQPKVKLKEGEGRATVIASGASLEVSVADFIKSMKDVSIADVNKAALEVLAEAGVEA